MKCNCLVEINSIKLNSIQVPNYSSANRDSIYPRGRYVCMYKLYLMTVKTWLQRNLPQGRLVSKS